MLASALIASARVAVIVVNWNGADDTIACLRSLAQLNVRAHRVYVIDNCSTDGSPDRIRSAHPDAEVVIAPSNLGYAGGANLGIQHALEDEANYIWLLNNDCLVEPAALEALIAADRRLGPAILSPKILSSDRPNELWYSGGYFDARLKSHHLGRGEIDDGQYDYICPVEWATGCSLFFSASVARHVGPMDERYFLYLEDVDWCLRARRKGVPLYYIPDARIYHRVSRSVDRLEPTAVRYYAWRNYYLLVSQHGSPWQRLHGYADLVSRFVKIALRHTFFPKFRRDKAYRARTRGLIDFVKGHFGEGPVGVLDYTEAHSPRSLHEATR